MANWRFFAGRDRDNVTLFANSVKNAQQQIAEMEKFDMPPSLSALFEIDQERPGQLFQRVR